MAWPPSLDFIGIKERSALAMTFPSTGRKISAKTNFYLNTMGINTYIFQCSTISVLRFESSQPFKVIYRIAGGRLYIFFQHPFLHLSFLFHPFPSFTLSLFFLSKIFPRVFLIYRNFQKWQLYFLTSRGLCVCVCVCVCVCMCVCK